MAARNTTVCSFFTSSSGAGCPYGALCNFSHDLSDMASGVVPAQTQTDKPPTDVPKVDESRRKCRFFRSGFCKDGAKCKNIHGVKDPESVKPRRQTKSVCSFYLSPNGCYHGQKCRYLHEVWNEPEYGNRSATKTNCKFFNSSRGCYAGERCNNLHVTALKQLEVSSEEVENKCDTTETTQIQQSNTATTSTQQRVCKYFISSDGCKSGAMCRFLHETNKERYAENLSQERSSEASASIAGVKPSAKPKQPRRRPCYSFNSTNGCRFGVNCRFLHEASGDSEAASVIKPQVFTNQRPASSYALFQSNLSDMTDEKQQEARNTEIEMVKKRYPQAVEVEREKGGMAHQITFIPTDPDWPYDVRSLEINIYFPQHYPKKMMLVSIPQQENLPETVRRCVSFSTKDWVVARFKNLQLKGRVERVFRAFLHWLDRDLEDIFTDALIHYKRELVAKAAGIEIIPARHLQARYEQEDDEDDDDDVDDVDEDEGNDTDIAGKPNEQEDVCEEESEEEVLEESGEEGEDSLKPEPFNPQPKGTEIKCKQLQLGETTGTLVAVTIMVRVRCDRCKDIAEVKAPNDRLNVTTCTKCNNTLLVKYRAALMHGFSSVMGYVDLEMCAPYDLILLDCDFLANCMGCNSDNKLGGIPPGQPKPTWCKSCHAKLFIAMEGVQFRQLQPTTIDKTDNAFRIEGTKAVRKVHDPVIKEGHALPNKGACKHYKKSFRWLRFPCCGKTYPCDICHEENEEHEFKFANRMICGFCCHEQMYSGLKPCSVCQSNLTKTSTEHWEGGKGCRDVIRMSRSDDKKYANSSSKTISRKAWAKKKNPKIRHTSS